MGCGTCGPKKKKARKKKKQIIMRITTQGDYGLICMLRIAQQKDRQPVSIQKISEEEQLSIDYIEQLLLKLRRAGIVKSFRGRVGGYLLARPASRISIKDIIQAVEGSVFDDICARLKHRGRMCVPKPKGSCLAKPVWQGLEVKIKDYLNNITVKSLMDSPKMGLRLAGNKKK